MTPRSGDTEPDTLERMSAIYAGMTPEEKLVRVRDLALAGLRSLHPDDDEGTLLLRLARRRLGDETVARAYASSRAAAEGDGT